MNVETISNSITPYQDLAKIQANNKSFKQLCCAIILSAIEDADIEFLTDDYDEWKKYRMKRLRKSDCLTEFDFKLEFQGKQDYKAMLFDACGIVARSSDIPSEIFEKRKMYENNKMSGLIKLTNYKKETLMNIAKLHGWKIGIDWVEPTIFDF